ncbi:MAG TPA: alpha/beta hydrolase [Polyangiaceae bacterium]|nr:alpha/beta hydrolase [Polyangiaceae bacterium]
MMHGVVFLPGIIAPAEHRYEPLLHHLTGVHPILKNLEIYRGDSQPAGYSITTEIEGVLRAANEAGLDRFHLYGHSAGGAIALALALKHPHRVLTLAVDEPASDFTELGNADYGWHEFDNALSMPPKEATAEFLRLQVAPGVALPPAAEKAPAWMAKRPAGMRAFIAALRAHRVTDEAYRGFTKPVYFTRGSLTHPRWALMEQRLSRLFPNFTSEIFEGLHHLNTCHSAEPERVAARLTTLWQRSA